MPETSNKPSLNLELDEPETYGRYMLANRVEILFVLRELQKRATILSIYFNHGQSFFLSTLVDVDDEKGLLFFEPAVDEALNRIAERATRLLVTAQHERIKIQFALGKLSLCSHGGRQLFCTTLPERLLRLQRREYFRLDAPTANPLHCEVPARRTDGSLHQLDLIVLDISGSGVGLMLPAAAEVYFQVGVQHANCRITLPGEGIIAMTLGVRSCYRVSPASAPEYLRAGCEFIGLSNARLSQVQRFITRIDRERKAKQSGLLT